MKFASLLSVVAGTVLSLAITACDSFDDHRLPPVNVNLVFTTQAQWDTYGVFGATAWQRYIKGTKASERVPSDFPYTVSMATGFGGILIVADVYGTLMAYDLSCPYECKADIRIEVDKKENVARCPECGSTYDIFAGYGSPLSGPAATHRYSLERYKVAGPVQGAFKVVTR